MGLDLVPQCLNNPAVRLPSTTVFVAAPGTAGIRTEADSGYTTYNAPNPMSSMV